MARIQIIDNPEVPRDARVAIVAGRYNRDIVDSLVEACVATLTGHGIDRDAVSIVKAPGAFELPLLAQALARRDDVDAVIALGAVIRGDTAHFDYVSGECARGLARVALDQDKPVIFGVLTVNNEQQARERAGNDGNNKGVEAANTALEMISVMRRVRS